MADELDEMEEALNTPIPTRLLKIAQAVDDKTKIATGQAVQSNVDPSIVWPDSDIDAQARGITEHYEAVESTKSANFASDFKVPPVLDENTQTGIDIMRNFSNFLFHDEMALLGVTWAKDNFEAKADTARDFIADHPWRAGLAVAANSGPLFAGAKRVARMFKGADAAIDTGKFVERGLIDSFEEYEALSPAFKTILNKQADRIADITETNSAIKDGTATVSQQIKASFHSAFGNAYLDDQALERMSPYSTLKEWSTRTEELMTSKTVTDMLDLADKVPSSEGTAILHALKDPSQLAGLGQEAKTLALTYGDEARSMQRQLLEEGFIDQDTADKVGDIWFSTLRQDSPMFEEGATTAVHSVIKRRALEPEPSKSIKVINIPRTGSANLKTRKLDSSQVTSLIKRQRAAEALDAKKPEQALALLNNSSETEAISLIKSDRIKDAKTVLAREGFIGSNPKDLVVKNLLQQKLLFENFKTLRDVALNPNLTKTWDEVQAMGSSTRARMMSLDKMENAATLRRMVAKKQGKESVDKLGYVHESLFESLADTTNEHTINSGIGLLEVATAILKTAKTSANPFTHLQNIVGNGIFLHMAGFNILNAENNKLVRQSWAATADWQKARKSGAAIAEVKDLGKLKSKIKGGKDIDIAAELQNPLLSGEHGILDMSSIEASEGIPMLGKLAKQAGDEQLFIKGLIKATQKGSKFTGIDKAADAYMAEDSSMKLAYFLHLRQNGLNPLAAANEVAKRLPMYGTVGGAIKRGRKVMFPWASFPTESVRIMKNNMIDHPFRTAIWMHAPNLVQAGAAMGPQAFGGKGMSYEEVEARKLQNPMYAQKLTGVVTGFRDKNNDVRTMLMDFLPHSSVLPPSVAATAGWRESLPLGVGNPAPIVTGFIDALMGRGSFGEDIATDPNNPASRVYSVITSTVGLLMPPLVQKYAFNPSLPNQAYRGPVDAGIYKNPSTGKTGDPLYDMILNNFAVKNYAGSAETEIANNRFGNREMQNYRGRLSKEFGAWVSSNRWENAADTLRDVAQTFLSETPDNPGLARQKYSDWLALHSREVLKHPSFRGISKEQFLSQLSKISDSVVPIIDQATQEYKNILIEGYRNAGRSRKQDGYNPLTRAARTGRTARGSR